MGAEELGQYLVSGLTHGAIYSLVGLGFTIIYAVTRIINFAQGEFVMLGGMISYSLARSLGMPLAPAVLVAILIATAVGAVVYLAAIRTARRASVVSLIIITIGAAIFIRGIAGLVWHKDYVRPPYFTGDDPISFFGTNIQPQALWIVGVTILVTIGLHLFLSYTMVGKALKACATNPRAAGIVGIDAKAMALIAFALAAAIGAIGGAVLAPLTTMNYGAGVMLGLKGFIAASIGGFKSPVATVAGGFLLGIIESLSVAINWGPFSSDYKDAIALLILLLILLARAAKPTIEETEA